MCPAGITCLISEPARGLDDPWCIQRGGEVVELLDRVRCGAAAAWPSRHHPPVTVEPVDAVDAEGAVVVGEITRQLTAIGNRAWAVELGPQPRTAMSTWVGSVTVTWRAHARA